MRFGAPVYGDISTHEQWIAVVKGSGYRSAYCPVPLDAPSDRVAAYAHAAREADIVIAEVGAWSNPLSDDPETRQKAIAKCQQGLDLAERIGAVCCVNISGSRGEPWDGPHPLNLTADTFDKVVAVTRQIIDTVAPKRAFFTLEPMPWAFPDSPASYLRLLQAIDRPQFAVHLDPVNMISSPQRYFDNAAFLRECFAILGPAIKSCHAKDITLSAKLTTHLDEVRPGLGNLDYRVFLQEVERLDPELPVLLEHLPSAEEYAQAAAYVIGVAKELGISV